MFWMILKTCEGGLKMQTMDTKSVFIIKAEKKEERSS